MALPKPARSDQDSLPVRVTVQYQPDGTGLRDAYRILAKSVVRKRGAQCALRSISG
jgi:hypothetical protein